MMIIKAQGVTGFHTLIIAERGYPGIEDLQHLDRCRQVPPPQVPTQLKVDVSPLRWEVWQECLAPHSDEQFSEYIVRGIRDGFRIGFDYSRYNCRTVKENMRSALEHADVVREYLAKECAFGRVLGPFDPGCLPEIQVSRFGVIPKGTSG